MSVLATVPSVADVQAFLEGFASVETRLAATAALVLVGLSLSAFVLPFLYRRVRRTVTDRLRASESVAGAATFADHLPSIAGRVTLRTVQAVVVVATAAAALLVWGLTDVVLRAGRVALGSAPAVGKVVGTTLVLFGAYAGFELLRDSISRFSSNTPWMTDHQEEILLRMSQLVLMGFVVLVVLTIWEVNLDGLLVGAGFLGIVVGLAARQTLGSIIAGFLLMFSRPFTIGDWVEVGKNEGIVTDITIVNTRMENFDGETVIIPNDKVSEKAITNRSNRGGLRLSVDVGVDYDVDTERATEVAREAIDDVDIVAEGPPPQVIPKAFGDSAVVLELRFWIDNPSPPRKWEAISGVVRSVKTAFEDEDLKIPFPQRELSGRAETDGFRVQGVEAGESTVGVDLDATDGE